MARVRSVPDRPRETSRRAATTTTDEEQKKKDAIEKPGTSAAGTASATGASTSSNGAGGAMTTGGGTENRRTHKTHDELKHLQDSLTIFFTPTAGRRCRYPPKKFDDELPETERIKKETTVVAGGAAVESDVRFQKPLSIDVGCSNSAPQPTPVKSQPNSKSSGQSPAKSGEPSPSRRACERLVDSLSPYFSVSSERRRNGGYSVKEDIVKQESTTSGTSPIALSLSPNEGSPKKMSARRRGDELKKVVGGRHTQNSASAALFGSPVEEVARSSSEGDCPPHKKGRTPKVKKVIKVEKEDDDYPEEKVPATPVSMKEKKKRKSITDTSALSPSCSATGEKENFGADGAADGQIQITDASQDRFRKAQRQTQQVIDEAIKQFHNPNNPTKDPHWPESIRIGQYEIKTWYSAPFPQEYADTPVLHICEFCLQYKKSSSVLSHHKKKCDYRFPPGNEIYRSGSVSVFEVDGNQARIYCQNLCLIAKLFLDHKTLYYDVEPFLFYVVTTNDEYGCHFVGYFSKEKYSTQKFNLSCIVTLPCYQKMGFGRFLIDFSFLLSRQEGLVGTPERPLSDLGRISYASYWRTAIFEWLFENMNANRNFKLLDISKGTGITTSDIVEVFDSLEWFQKTPEGVRLEMNWTMIETQWKRAKGDKSRIWIDPSALKWTPVQYTPTKDFGVRSPVRLSTPHRSPTSTANVGSTPTGVSIAAVGSTVKKGCGSPRSSKKTAARRKLTLGSRKEQQPSTSDSSEESEAEVSRPKNTCKDPHSRRRTRHDSSPDPDASESEKKTRRDGRNGIDQRQTTTPSLGTRRTSSSRGKAVYEGDRSSSPSSSSSFSEDDKDESFSLGGRNGKKPQKGKGAPVPRKKKAPPKKAGKSPGKIFPPNYGKRDPTPEPSTPQRCDSAGTSATVPMIQGAEGCATPGGGRTLNDVEDEPVPLTPVPCEVAPSTSSPPPSSQRPSRNSHRHDPRSTTASSANNSEMSDDSRPHSPCSPLSTCSTPPIGGHEQHMVMNMGGVPDDEVASRCDAMSVESDQPPQLHAVGGTSSDEAPPILPPEEQNPPILSAPEGYNTDDDEAPPQLSPVMMETHHRHHREGDPTLTEEQRQQIAMDQPPKAPVMLNSTLEDDDHMPFESAQEPCSSAQSIMEPSSSKSMITQVATPQNTYPGSLKQHNTPGSVPSCQMQNQMTPEMQAPFLSPGMQGIQPTSVSSVHSMQNASMEMPPSSQPFPPLSVAPQSDPSTPLRGTLASMSSSFGSPQGVQHPASVVPPQQIQQMPPSVPSTSNSRRSGEGSRKQRSQQHLVQHQQQPVVPPQFPANQYPMPMMQQYPFQQYHAGYYDPATFAAQGHPYWPNYPYTKSAAAAGTMVF